MVLTTSNPIDLGPLHGPSVTFVRIVAIVACVVVAALPRPPYLFLAGFPVLYWALRATDLLLEADGDPERLATALSVLALALVLYCYFAAAIRAEAMFRSVLHDIDERTNGAT